MVRVTFKTRNRKSFTRKFKTQKSAVRASRALARVGVAAKKAVVRFKRIGRS